MEDSNNLIQLQLLQQNLQNILMQKQQFQQELVEIESALSELPNSHSAYQIHGKLMISKSKEDLIKELSDKKDLVNLRIKSVEEQENKIKENLEDVQKKFLSEVNKSKESDSDLSKKD